MTLTDLDTAISAVTHLLTKIDDEDHNNDRVSVALVTYGDILRARRFLTDSSSINELIRNIQEIPYEIQQCSKNGSNCDSSTLDDALNYSNDIIFNDTSTGSDDERNIVIIVTNGRENFSQTTQRTLEDLKRIAPYVYAVATGDDADMNNIRRIVEDPTFVYFTRFQEKPSNLDVLMGEIFYSTCSLTNVF